MKINTRKKSSPQRLRSMDEVSSTSGAYQKTKGSHRRRFKWVKRMPLITGTFLVIFAISGSYFFHLFEGNITTQKFIVPDKDRPVVLPEVKGARNILIMGSDDRRGSKIGGVTPGLSDTTILLHLSANRKFAYGVSIPRDTMINRTACPFKDGRGTDPGGFTQFNAAFAIGGPACTVATVEAATGVRVNNFVVVNFNGFQKMVDAIGGVKMCVPTEVNDPIGKIYLKAGTYTMDGETALDYVRVRHGIGADIGDIGRMKRQQSFIASMVEKIMSQGTLANPVKILNLLDSSTSSLTTDPDFADLRKLAGLASSLKGIGSNNIQFITVPIQPYPQNPNRVILASGAEGIWFSIIHDKPIGSDFMSGAISPESETPFTGKESSVKKVSPDDNYPTETRPNLGNNKIKDITEDEKISYGLC